MVIKLETQLEPLNLLNFCQGENLHRKGPSIGVLGLLILIYYYTMLTIN